MTTYKPTSITLDLPAPLVEKILTAYHKRDTKEYRSCTIAGTSPVMRQVIAALLEAHNMKPKRKDNSKRYLTREQHVLVKKLRSQTPPVGWEKIGRMVGFSESGTMSAYARADRGEFKEDFDGQVS